jgi:hypothetical protein
MGEPFIPFMTRSQGQHVATESSRNSLVQLIDGEPTVAIGSAGLTQYPVLAPDGEDVVAEVVQKVIGARGPEPSGAPQGHAWPFGTHL